MTAKERALTKRLADLEARIKTLEAAPREVHHHHYAPQPITVQPYTYQPYPWYRPWITVSGGYQAGNNGIVADGFSQVVDSTVNASGIDFSYTDAGVQS